MEEAARAIVRDAPPLTVIDLYGEVTAPAEKPIKDAYQQVVALGAKHILLNFSEVDHVNSAGIAVVISLLTDARPAGRHILLTGLTPHYLKIFGMMGLPQYAPHFETEEEARASVAGG